LQRQRLFPGGSQSHFKCFGNRGYRAAELEAKIIGGKLYLAAYAQHLSTSGLTFVDDDVIDFCSLSPPKARARARCF
jgi:hypothetical protein